MLRSTPLSVIRISPQIARVVDDFEVDLEPRGSSCRFQKSYISFENAVSVSCQPASNPLLMARPRSVKAVGNRKASTSVSPFLTARWTIRAARLSASSSETPDGWSGGLSIPSFRRPLYV